MSATQNSNGGNSTVGQRATELATALQQFMRERQRLHDLPELPFIGYVISDARGTILETNEAAAQWLGTPREALVGVPLESYMSEGQRRAFQAYMNRLALGEFSGSSPTIRLQPLLGPPLIATIVQLVGPEIGASGGLAWTIQQMVRGERAEDEVRERIFAAIDDLPDAVYIIDKDWCLLYVNQKGWEYISAATQVPLHDIPGKPIWTAIPALVGTEYERQLRMAVQKETPVRFEAFLPALGVWRSVRAYPSESGLVIYSTDITQRKLAEAALEKSETRFRSVLESQPEGVLIVDPEGRITFVNPAAERMFGYAPGELLGQVVEVLVPQQWRGRHVGHRAEYFQSPRVRPMGEYRDLTGRRKDSSEFPVEISLSFTETEEGLHAIGFIVDITRRHLAEKELRTRSRQLATVAELGHIALGDVKVPAFMNEVTSRAAHVLATEFTAVFHLCPGSDEALLQAGVGWQPRSLGVDTVAAGPGSWLRRVASGEVLVAGEGSQPLGDLLSPSPLAADHELVYGVGVPLSVSGEPYGAFVVATAEERQFSQDEVAFLRAIGAILSSALEAAATEDMAA